MKFVVDNKEVNWKMPKNILTRGSGNLKLAKSEKLGVFSTMGLHLAPADMSGFNVCPKCSPGCKAGCLTFSGQGQMFRSGEMYTSDVHVARIGRTRLFRYNRPLFFKMVKREIDLFLKRCEKKGTKPAIRTNCTSDLAWEKIPDPETGKTLMELYPMIQFYDYTKIFSRLGKTPENYFLNFSRSECNEKEALKALEMGINVTVVFKKDLPDNYKGYRVINGDETDLRFLDNKFFENSTGKGLVVGLKAKGSRAKKDRSGFVIQPEQWTDVVYTKSIAA